MGTSKIIGIVVIALIVLAGVGYGAYTFGVSQNKSTTSNTNNDKNNSDTNANSSHNSNNANNTSNITPKVVTDPTCNADELSISLGDGNGAAAGSRSLSIIFTNTGTRECVLGGYPGVSLVNDNGNQIGSPAERTSSTDEKTITLQQNGSVSALVTYPVEANFDAGTCKDGATKLRVYPPNDYGYISIASPVTGWCPGFQVGPVTAAS